MSATVAAYPNEFVTRLPDGFLGDRIIEVRAGQNLQALVNVATGGEVFLTEPGDYGTLRFPARMMNGWAVIVSKAEAQMSRLPSIAQESLEVRFSTVTGGGEAITGPTGAGGWRLIGAGAKSTNPSAQIFNLVALYKGSARFSFEKFSMRGTPTGTTRRGVMLNAADVAFRGVRGYDLHEVGSDSQAICGWDGPGPYLIEDFDLEAAGENILFGGARATTTGLVPSNILIRRGRLGKPLHWKIGHPTYAGIPWTIKNLFEVKNARRVRVEDTLMDHCWPHGQMGYAIVLTPRGEGGHNYWASCEDVFFDNLTMRDCYNGISILGRDNNDGQPRPGDVPPSVPFSQRTARITFDNILGLVEAWGVLLNAGPTDVMFRRATIMPRANPGAPPWPASFVATNRAVVTERLTVQDSVMGGGFTVDGGEPIPLYAPGADFARTVMLGGFQNGLVGAEFMSAAAAKIDVNTGKFLPGSPLIGRLIGVDHARIENDPPQHSLKTPMAITLSVQST